MNEGMEKGRNKGIQEGFRAFSREICKASWCFKGICDDARDWEKKTIFSFKKTS